MAHLTRSLVAIPFWWSLGCQGILRWRHSLRAYESEIMHVNLNSGTCVFTSWLGIVVIHMHDWLTSQLWITSHMWIMHVNQPLPQRSFSFIRRSCPSRRISPPPQDEGSSHRGNPPGDPHPRCGVCVAGILNWGKRSPTWPSCPLYPGDAACGRMRYPPKTVVMCNRYQPGTPNNIKQPVFFNGCFNWIIPNHYIKQMVVSPNTRNRCWKISFGFYVHENIPPSHWNLNASMKNKTTASYSIRNNMKRSFSHSQLPTTGLGNPKNLPSSQLQGLYYHRSAEVQHALGVSVSPGPSTTLPEFQGGTGDGRLAETTSVVCFFKTPLKCWRNCKSEAWFMHFSLFSLHLVTCFCWLS